jgi:acetyl-CoA acetyltransferase
MIRNRVAIVGMGQTPAYRRTEASLGTLVLRAARDAIRDAGLKGTDIDGLAARVRAQALNIAFPADGLDRASTMYVADGLGLGTLSWCAGLNEGANQVAAFVEGVHALVAGACNYVLLYNQVARPKDIAYGATTELASRGPEQFMRPYGWLLAMQRPAAWLNRMFHEKVLTEEDLGYVVMNDRKWAARNPAALLRDPMTMDQYLASKPLVPPLKLADCDMPVDAAYAWVITTVERARNLPHKPIYISAAQVGLSPHSGDHDSGGIFGFPDLTRTVHDYTMRTLWENAGMSRDDMDIAMLYEGFSPMALFWLQALGYAGKGEAGAVMRDIYTGKRGPAVNTHGGVLSTGRNHGAAAVSEAVLQLRGAAGDRQVAGANAAVVTMGGIMQDSGAMVLTSKQA